MPRGVGGLVRAVVKQIPEDTIDETLDGILDFLGAAFTEIEKIRQDETREDLIAPADSELQPVVSFVSEKTA